MSGYCRLLLAAAGHVVLWRAGQAQGSLAQHCCMALTVHCRLVPRHLSMRCSDQMNQIIAFFQYAFSNPNTWGVTYQQCELAVHVQACHERAEIVWKER